MSRPLPEVTADEMPLFEEQGVRVYALTEESAVAARSLDEAITFFIDVSGFSLGELLEPAHLVALEEEIRVDEEHPEKQSLRSTIVEQLRAGGPIPFLAYEESY